MAADALLASWRDTPARRAIVEFVERVTTEDEPGFVPPAERVAVFDNDGTLWCEKPMPIQLGLHPLFRMVEPWREADSGAEGPPAVSRPRYERDYRWLGEAMVQALPR